MEEEEEQQENSKKLTSRHINRLILVTCFRKQEKESKEDQLKLVKIMHILTSLNPRITFPRLSYKPESEFCSTHPRCLFIKNSSCQPEFSNYLFPPANQSVAAIVFGDGSSQSRLYPLTKRRSEAAIPIAGNYRLIDAVVSNCINSDITKIYALTQFNSTSLNSHLSRAYSGGRRLREGFVEVIAAYQSPEDNDWFQGTADAIRRCLWVLEEYPVLDFLILPGHHLYKMDYQNLIDVHRRSKADITMSVYSRRKDEDLGFGIFKLNAENRVIEFKGKPDMNNIKAISVDNMEMFNQDSYPSMGIYVIKRNVMRKLLTEYFPKANNLMSEVILGAISLGMEIQAYNFDGYWEDMKSIGAYYQANMETIRRRNKAYDFYDKDFPVYTLPRHLPPTLIADAIITDSVIGDGCILNKCRIKGTVVGMRTRIGDNAVIEDSVIMGSDTYHHSGIGEWEGIDIPIGIGEGSNIRKAIVDKNARIGKNVMIINRDNVEEGNMDANGYIISGGIIVIMRNAVIPDGTIL